MRIHALISYCTKVHTSQLYINFQLISVESFGSVICEVWFAIWSKNLQIWSWVCVKLQVPWTLFFHLPPNARGRAPLKNDLITISVLAWGDPSRAVGPVSSGPFQQVSSAQPRQGFGPLPPHLHHPTSHQLCIRGGLEIGHVDDGHHLIKHPHLYSSHW